MMKKWWIIFVVLLAVGIAVFMLMRERPEEQLRRDFLSKCEEVQSDTVEYIKALKSADASLCEEITDKNVVLFCKAEVFKDKELCNEISIMQMVKYCKTVAAKDKDACNNNYQCLAYTTGDVSYCNKVRAGDINECKAVVLRDLSLLGKTACRDASYLLLGKSDKEWCRKISDELIRQECLE
ncbi:MAG: hypothetical protein HY363_02500 [Candidatus Aenigmarchaeota archaeon]|nr:hypothetical protein [Candidatus Aenigmarchaeota archaeon]